VSKHVFQLADYGITVRMDNAAKKMIIHDEQRLRSLESASFRTFDAADEEAEKMFKASVMIGKIRSSHDRSETVTTSATSNGGGGLDLTQPRKKEELRNGKTDPQKISVNSQRHGAFFMKTSDPLDFYVNHFSGWAHWYASHHTSSSLPSPLTSSSSSSSSSDKQTKTHLTQEVDNYSKKIKYGGRGGSLEQLTVKLSGLMEQECMVLNKSLLKNGFGTHQDEEGVKVEVEEENNDEALSYALALIPFWSGTVAESGGNAHYEAASLELKLQQVKNMYIYR
jgi:hypothetical protein